jgi:phytoene synthase
MSAAGNARRITKASKSNLALAFISLRGCKRRDMTTFYAFCRLVDDIADTPGRSLAEKQASLDDWKRAIEDEFPGEPSLAAELRDIIRRREIPISHFLEIIAGVEMDLAIRSYATFEDLRVYCHRVASVVGLVSSEIFGYTNPRCKEYAVDLGLALQLTNILRDVGEDFANDGRVYLPQQDMERFGCTREDIAAHRRGSAFLSLMTFESQRAIAYYRSALAHLPPEDLRSMLPAEIMRAIYSRLLIRMREDGFRVFDRRYSLGRLGKMAVIARVVAGAFLNRPLDPFVS